MAQNSRKTPRIFSKQTIGRILIFSVFIFIAAMFQTAFLPGMNVFSVIPDLMLTAVLGIGFFDGERSGAIAGIGAGIIAASLGGTGSLMLPLLYMPIGYFSGILIKKYLNKNIVSWIVYVSIATAARELYGVLCMVVTEDNINLFLMLTEILIPEALLTMLFSLIQYPLSKLCTAPFRADKESITSEIG